MAGSDYLVHGTVQQFVPYGTLTNALSITGSAAQLSGFDEAGDGAIVGGMAVMIGTEICKLLGMSGNSIAISRGCADTIPKAHIAGTPVWLLGVAFGTDGETWGADQDVAVKPIVTSSSGRKIPVASTPPLNVTTNHRFDRPYPPGRVLVNEVPWHSELFEIDDDEPLVLEWKHRDRVTQADVLVDHEADSIGPEAGTTYWIGVYDEDDLLCGFESTSGTTVTLTQAAVAALLGAETDDKTGYLLLRSVRDSLASLNQYRIDFVCLALDTQPYGLGYRLGESLGGIEP